MFIKSVIVLMLFEGVIIKGDEKLSQKTVDFWDETEPFGQTGSPSPDLRLPSYVVPSFYRLKLKAELENSTYSGDVYITLKASKSVKEIILHSKNLSISSNAKLTEQIYEKVETLRSLKVKREAPDVNVTTTADNTTTEVPTTSIADQNATTATVPETTTTEDNATTLRTDTTPAPTPVDTEISHSAVRTIKILSIVQGTGDRLILGLESALKANVDYVLQLSFEGAISNSLTGFYKSTYVNDKNEVKNLGVTQFEPTSARSAFPCFDEPAFKAKFEISIAHPETVTALSNMKIVAQEPVPDQPGWQWTHFDRSVSMSTYLVAYVLSDFKSLETSYTSTNNVTIPIRIWTRPELIGKAKYASVITPKLLAYYEEVFGVPYALDKMDLIAIPDFSSGAMENWGLVTFRETTLLFDEAESVPRDKQNVAIDIAHELAHQWFGNLVTMRWWTDLWLNEGFATYIEYVGVDHVEPEWNMFESFSRDKMDLLRSDALKNTSPVSRKVEDASEISQKFDEISYTKGANLIRMLNHTISEDLFHKGLVIYLNQWKYSNAEENDLWHAMSKATPSDPALKDLNVVDFMNSWTRQAGYPVVSVNRNYETGRVDFEQRLFTAATDPYQKMLDQLWHIPISYCVVDSPVHTWTSKPKTWLKGRTTAVNLPINDTQALYVNVDAIGYYRVNYDKKNWELLSIALKTGQIKSPITKSQLIDDAFNLAKVSRLNYSYALGLTTCVINGEDSKMVWDLLLNNMAFLRHNLRATSGYVYFQDYMRILLAKQLEKVNYGLSKPKDDNEAFLIENLVMWECYVESPRCLQWAREQFDNWTRQDDVNNNPIPSYLRGLVYNMVLRHGGRTEFEFLYRVFQTSTDPNVKTLIINNLPSTREESLITLLLERSLSEIPKQYAVAAWSVEAPLGTRLAQDFLLNHFHQVYDKFTQMDAFMFPAVLSGSFGFISTEEELTRLKNFALKHKEQLMPMSQTLQKLVDTATFRIDWVRKHSAGISKWFQDYVSGPSPTMTTSMTASSVLTNSSTIYQGPFHLHSRALGLRAQQLWLMAEILTNNDDEEIFDKSFQVSISIEGVLADHSNTEEILSEADAPNRTQHLKCKKRVCEEVMILHILWLDYTHYVFNINFYGLKEFHHRYIIRDIVFYFKTYNPAFTQMETWFRFIFVMTSFFMTFWFAYMMRKYPMSDWSIEQRWIYILLPSLLTFNDPLYPLRFFPGAIMAPLIGNFFQTTFLAAVMLSWLSQYHGLRQNDRGIVSFYLFKFVLVGLCVIPAFMLGNWQKFSSYLDPTFNYMMDPDYPLVKLWFFCAITIYFLYLLILIIKAYSDLRNMPFFDIRLRCLSIVVGTVTSIITVLALQGWGPAALQDHWACQPKIHFDTSAPFMALYGLFNFYIYILAYLFSPGGGSLHETAITKDNPAFSMINDSDEEVIYGSDEESRRPLNSHHRITTDEDL